MVNIVILCHRSFCKPKYQTFGCMLCATNCEKPKEEEKQELQISEAQSKNCLKISESALKAQLIIININ